MKNIFSRKFKFDSWIRNYESLIRSLRSASNKSYSPLTFLYYFTNLSFFREKCTLPYFWENKQNSNPHSLCNAGEIQLWLIKTNCFTYLLLQIKLVIIKIFTFKSENVAFNKLPKKLMIRNNKIYKMIEFFTIFIISFYFEELYSGTT